MHMAAGTNPCKYPLLQWQSFIACLTVYAKHQWTRNAAKQKDSKEEENKTKQKKT